MSGCGRRVAVQLRPAPTTCLVCIHSCIACLEQSRPSKAPPTPGQATAEDLQLGYGHVAVDSSRTLQLGYSV